MLVVAVVALLINRRITFAGIFFGFALHFKTYPVIYYVPFLLWIDMTNHNNSIFTKNRLKFLFFSVLTFSLLLWFFYMQYDWTFIDNVYLY